MWEQRDNTWPNVVFVLGQYRTLLTIDQSYDRSDNGLSIIVSNNNELSATFLRTATHVGVTSCVAHRLLIIKNCPLQGT